MAACSDYKSIPEFLKDLLQLDKEIREPLILIYDGIAAQDKHAADTVLTGSTVEGAFLARWFHPEPNIHELEVDLQHIGIHLLEDDRHLIETMEGNDDHVYIKHDPTLLQQRMKEKVKEFANEFEGDYLNPTIFRSIGNRFHQYDTKFNFDILKALSDFGYDSKQMETTVDKSEKGTAVTRTVTLRDKKAENAFITQASIDNVPAVRCDFWPEHAADFASRSQPNGLEIWPPPCARKQLIDEGCDIVPKTSPNGDTTKEWRWSFSRAEGKIMTMLSEDQQQGYLLTKILFYMHIKPLDNDAIHSYWLKTALFWVCEEYPPDHNSEVWSQAACVVKKILKRLKIMLGNNWLPHFFAPSVNLIRYSNAEIIECVARELDKMINRIHSFFPQYNECQALFVALEYQREIVKTVYYFTLIACNALQGQLDAVETMLRQLAKQTSNDFTEHLARMVVEYLKRYRPENLERIAKVLIDDNTAQNSVTRAWLHSLVHIAGPQLGNQLHIEIQQLLQRLQLFNLQPSASAGTTQAGSERIPQLVNNAADTVRHWNHAIDFPPEEKPLAFRSAYESVQKTWRGFKTLRK